MGKYHINHPRSSTRDKSDMELKNALIKMKNVGASTADQMIHNREVVWSKAGLWTVSLEKQTETRVKKANGIMWHYQTNHICAYASLQKGTVRNDRGKGVKDMWHEEKATDVKICFGSLYLHHKRYL